MTENTDKLIKLDENSEAIESNENEKLNKADQLIEIAQETSLELWHTREKQAWVTISEGDSLVHLPVEGQLFSDRLRLKFMEKNENRSVADSALKQAVSTLAALARQGDEHEIRLRTAEHAGNFYVDLNDDKHRVVEISATDWRVISASEIPEVRFYRPRTAQPLPEPAKGGNNQDLFDFLNLADNNDEVLVMAWIVAAFCPAPPYPILAIEGSQGSGKSTFAKLLRFLIDPSVVAVRGAPGDQRDFKAAVANSWVLNFDNLSHIFPKMADIYCQISTGSGMAARRLYSDSEEDVIDATRPIIVNGITRLARRPDLLDRTLVLQLADIDTSDRRSEQDDIFPEFEKKKAGILGCIFTAMSVGLSVTDLEIPELPRLADFAQWATKCETGFGFEKGAFLERFNTLADETLRENLEDNELATALMEYTDDLRSKSISSGGPKDGILKYSRPKELLQKLEDFQREQSGLLSRRSKYWPDNARGLVDQFKRLKPSLQKVGYLLESPDRNDTSRHRNHWGLGVCTSTCTSAKPMCKVTYQCAHPAGQPQTSPAHRAHSTTDVHTDVHAITTTTAGVNAKCAHRADQSPTFKNSEKREKKTRNAEDGLERKGNHEIKIVSQNDVHDVHKPQDTNNNSERSSCRFDEDMWDGDPHMSMSDYLVKSLENLEDDDEDQENPTASMAFPPNKISTTNPYEYEHHGQTHTLEAEKIERIHKKMKDNGENHALDDVISAAKELAMESLHISETSLRFQLGDDGW